MLCQILGTVQNILKPICPSFIFNLELLCSELSVHNSWLFNDTICNHQLHVHASEQAIWKQFNSLHCEKHYMLRLKTENSKTWVVTCRMRVLEIGSVPEGGPSENWTPDEHTPTHTFCLYTDFSKPFNMMFWFVKMSA